MSTRCILDPNVRKARGYRREVLASLSRVFVALSRHSAKNAVEAGAILAILRNIRSNHSMSAERKNALFTRELAKGGLVNG